MPHHLHTHRGWAGAAPHARSARSRAVCSMSLGGLNARLLRSQNESWVACARDQQIAMRLGAGGNASGWYVLMDVCAEPGAATAISAQSAQIHWQLDQTPPRARSNWTYDLVGIHFHRFDFEPLQQRWHHQHLCRHARRGGYTWLKWRRVDMARRGRGSASRKRIARPPSSCCFRSP